jgi:hypothetical protein
MSYRVVLKARPVNWGRGIQAINAQDPNAVPELIKGDSVDALTASVETAKTVVGCVAEQVRRATAAATVLAGVPGAGTAGQALDSMSAMA